MRVGQRPPWFEHALPYLAFAVLALAGLGLGLLLYCRHGQPR